MTSAEGVAEGGWLHAATARFGVFAALLTGAALPLAFSPLDIAPLAVFSPAVLFLILAAAPRRRALQAAYVYGVGYFGVGVSWVFVSIHEFGGSGPVISGLVTAAFVLMLACFPLLVAAAALGIARYRRLSMGSAVVCLVVLPAAWVMAEWLRSWLFTGFPWALIGYAALDTPLQGLATVVGVPGLSAVLVWLAGGVAWLILRPGRRRSAILVAAVSGLFAASVAADRPWGQVDGDAVTAAVIQGNIPQDVKWLPQYRDAVRGQYLHLTQERLGAELIVWPETAIPEFFDQAAGEFLEPVGAAVREAGGTLVLGVPYGERGAGPIHNSIAALNETPAFYHKRHLVPYGEYVPFRDLFGRSLDFLGAPMADYTPGPPARPLPAGDHVLGATVCYEVAYARAVAAALPEAQLLVNVSNDAWFGDSLAPHQHLQKARMRSLETRRWMVRATNTGISAVIDHRGRVRARAPQFEATTLVAEVEPRAGTTPYVVLGDAPVVGAAALALLITAGSGWRRRSREQG